MISQAAILIEIIFRGVRKISKSDYWHRHICLSVRPSLRRHGTSRLPMDGFSWNSLFEYFFRKFLKKLQVWLSSGKN